MKTFSTAIRSVVHASFFVLCLSFLATNARSQPVWQTVNISGLAPGSQLAAVSARNRDEAYVWANSAAGAGLYRWDGGDWSKVLDAPADSGVSVATVGAAEVFAASNTNIWRSIDNGHTWMPQPLPAFPGGSYQLGKISGTPNNVHVKVSQPLTYPYYGYIMLFDGVSWQIIYADQNPPANANPPYTLSVIGPNEGYFVTCWGWGQWNGSAWQFNGRQFDFCDIYDTWAVRDATNGLHWYAVGNNNFANGIRVWQFDTAANSFDCKSCYVFADGTNYDVGSAYSIWGSSASDVYVAGSLAASPGGQRAGKLYHFDGATWSQITAIGQVSETGDVSGSAPDDVWLSLSEDARLLHYAPPPAGLRIDRYAGLTISGQVGATYQVQYATDLNPPVTWIDLTNVTLSTSPYLYFDASSPTRRNTFYRALLAP